MPAGRPAKMTEDAMDSICCGIMSGKSLQDVCAENNVTHTTIYRKMNTSPQFNSAFARARQESAFAIMERCIDIADNLPADDVLFKSACLRIRWYKWLASRYNPETFGHVVTKKTAKNTNEIGGLIQRIEAENQALVCLVNG